MAETRSFEAVNAGNDQTLVASSFTLGGGSKIVVNSDDWTLSDKGFANGDAKQYILNIANWFTGGRPGNFLAYSNDFGLTDQQLANTMTNAGNSWTVSSGAPPTLADLAQYDGVFLLTSPVIDNQVLIDYVHAGGNVYVGAGSGAGLDVVCNGNTTSSMRSAYNMGRSMS